MGNSRTLHCTCGNTIKIEILGLAELAQVVGKKSTDLSMYHRRGTLPPPDFLLKCGPVWLSSNPQVIKFINKFNNEEV